MLHQGVKLLLMVLPLLVDTAEWNPECPLKPTGATAPANSKVRCTISGGCKVTCKRGYTFHFGERQIFYKCQDGRWHLEAGDPKYYKECRPFCKPACMNGGHCIAPNTCQCQEGWHGRACRRAPAGTVSCSPPCENGGFCIMTNTCECLEGYTGQTCHNENVLEANANSSSATNGHRSADYNHDESQLGVDTEDPASERLDAAEDMDYKQDNIDAKLQIDSSVKAGCSCSVPWMSQTSMIIVVMLLMK